MVGSVKEVVACDDVRLVTRAKLAVDGRDSLSAFGIYELLQVILEDIAHAM